MSTPYRFAGNDYPTLGVEIELNLVDAESCALRSAVLPLLDALPPDLKGSVKPELMQCYIEINTGICRDVAAVERDLAAKIRAVQTVAAGLGLRLFWSGTHPFSFWHDQEVTPNERYQGLIELLQESARRLVTFGLHVHVGVDSGDKAIMICDRILRHLPTLLALSANSPFWSGRRTGLHSQRVKVMEGLPTAGLPPLMRNWSEYMWLMNHMVETGFIKTIREIWWDVRPHHNFGTVEIRMCDMPPDLPSVLALTALIQCLVYDLSEEIDRGTYQFDCHPFMVRQNKWRACRFGLDAQLVDPASLRPLPARRVIRKLVERLSGVGQTLGCADWLEAASALSDQPTGSAQQLAHFERCGNLPAVVAQMLARSEL